MADERVFPDDYGWDDLMELLAAHWPEDIFPTMPDRTDRDPGPRIVSLIRRVDVAEAKDAEPCRNALAAARREGAVAALQRAARRAGAGNDTGSEPMDVYRRHGVDIWLHGLAAQLEWDA